MALAHHLSEIEAKMNISYHGSFDAVVVKGKCIVRGCENGAIRKDHILCHAQRRHNPEHEVVAIILDQRRCLQCNQVFVMAGHLKQHERDIHREEYVSRMEIFVPLLGHLGKSYVLISCNRPLISYRLYAYYRGLSKSSQWGLSAAHGS